MRKHIRIATILLTVLVLFSMIPPVNAALSKKADILESNGCNIDCSKPENRKYQICKIGSKHQPTPVAIFGEWENPKLRGILNYSVVQFNSDKGKKERIRIFRFICNGKTKNCNKNGKLVFDGTVGHGWNVFYNLMNKRIILPPARNLRCNQTVQIDLAVPQRGAPNKFAYCASVVAYTGKCTPTPTPTPTATPTLRPTPTSIYLQGQYKAKISCTKVNNKWAVKIEWTDWSIGECRYRVAKKVKGGDWNYKWRILPAGEGRLKKKYEVIDTSISPGVQYKYSIGVDAVGSNGKCGETMGPWHEFKYISCGEVKGQTVSHKPVNTGGDNIDAAKAGFLLGAGTLLTLTGWLIKRKVRA